MSIVCLFICLYFLFSIYGDQEEENDDDVDDLALMDFQQLKNKDTIALEQQNNHVNKIQKYMKLCYYKYYLLNFIKLGSTEEKCINHPP